MAFMFLLHLVAQALLQLSFGRLTWYMLTTFVMIAMILIFRKIAGKFSGIIVLLTFQSDHFKS
jgi:hypothetical protein